MMGIWDIVESCRNAAQVESQCKTGLKRQQEIALNLGTGYNHFIKNNIVLEHKMTREEAVIKIQKATNFIYSKEFINALEALGLLKFEEEVKDEFIHLVPEGYTKTVELNKEVVIRFLRSLGYKVEKV